VSPGRCPRLHVRARRLDAEVDPLHVAGPHGVVWESPALVLGGRGEAGRLPVDGVGALDRAASTLLGGITIEGDPGAPGPVAVAALPFDRDATGSLVVPALQVRATPDGSRWALWVGDSVPSPGARPPTNDELHDCGPRRRVPSAYQVGAVEPPEQWMAAVAAGRQAVRAGRLHKVVLVRAVDIEADEPLDPTALLRRLRAGYPSCFRFAVDGFVGASPELLVGRRGDVVRAQPMAGTAPRLGDPVADAQQAARLLASAKDRVEHQVTIDAVEAALLPYCSYLDAQADPQVVAVANVCHLATLVEGRLSQPLASVTELVDALHPTPAVGGHPTPAALELIGQLEPHGRGRYAGPVGWVDAEGDGEFAVGIRAAELAGRRARLFAGVGVVADSDPEAELEETRAKFQAMLSAVLRP